MKTPDPQLRQELLNTTYKPYEDAFNQNDATAVAALYTEDAVLVPPETDSVYGREAIEKVLCRPIYTISCQQLCHQARSVFPSYYRCRWRWIVEQWELECDF